MPKTPCKGGIYRITLKTDGRTYVGQTKNTFDSRWNKHRRRLNLNSHCNKYLQSTWNKYGAENFEFAVLEPIKYTEDLSDAESRWMSLYGATDRTRGFNLSGDTQGRISMSEETRQKLSKATKLNPPRIPADLSGRKFGSLLVVKEHCRKTNKADRQVIYWLCQCDCGKDIIAFHQSLTGSHTTSCGCKKIKALVERSTTHGHRGRKNNSITYNSWRGIVDRGRRGQCDVCQEWMQSFSSFLKDVGEKPSKSARLTRFDTSQQFKPGNCFWGTPKEWAQKHSSVKTITYNGETYCIEEWSRKLGISRSVIAWRLKQGWDTQKVLSPVSRLVKPVCDEPMHF